jgi:two-component system, LytTR family, response regulator
VAMSDARIRALVVDDEPAARDRLRTLLAAHADVLVVGECRDGEEAVDTLRTSRPDLVFLDVQMPRLDGFGVVASLGAERMPPAIFTSAYSEFAVRAFEAYALDYLLKPFDDRRLSLALDRAREEVVLRRSLPAGERDARLLGLIDHLGHARTATYPEAIAIKTGAQYVITRVADIDWIEADGNYAKLYVQRRPRLLTKTLATLEKDVLNPDVFLRVHRSAIVNITKVAAAEPDPHGDVTLVLHDGTRVQCSRRYRARLEEKVYFTS